ncbi:unnamed protein product [Ixodes hexagonus]
MDLKNQRLNLSEESIILCSKRALLENNVKTVLQELYDSPTGAHLGVHKTQQRVRHTPSMLLMGRELRLPADIMFGTPVPPPREVTRENVHLDNALDLRKKLE